MKKTVLGLLAAFGLLLTAFAQNPPNYRIVFATSVPSGACNSAQDTQGIVVINSGMYTCQAGFWRIQSSVSNEWSLAQSGVTGFTTNQVAFTTIIVPAPILTNFVMYNITIADNTAHLYNLMFYSGDGTQLLCQTGPIAGTTFAPSTGLKTMPWAAPCYLPAGRVIIATTGNSNAAQLSAGGSAYVAYGGYVITGNPTTNGVAPATLSVPAVNYVATTTGFSFSLHN